MSYSNLSKLNFNITNNFFIASGKIRHTWWGIFSCDLSLIRHRDHIICRKFLKCVYNVLFCLCHCICPWLRLCLCLFCLWAVQRGQTSFRFWWNVSLSEWSGEEKVTSRIEGWNSHGMLVIRQSQQYYCDLIFSFSKLFFLFLSNFKREDRVVWPFHAYCLLFRSSMLVGIALANCSDYSNFSSFFIKLLFANVYYYDFVVLLIKLLFACWCRALMHPHYVFGQRSCIKGPPYDFHQHICKQSNRIWKISFWEYWKISEYFWQYQGPAIWLPTTYMQRKQNNVENIKYLSPSGEAKWKWFCYQGEKIGRIWDLRVVGIPIAFELKQYTCCHSWSSLTKWGRG